MKQTLLNKHIHLQPDESIMLVVRKHWFVHLLDSLPIVIIGLVPFVLLPFVAPFISIEPSIPSFLTGVWLLVIWMIIFTVWTNYYLDIWIVTDKRIINIDQISLFTRSVSTLRIERVQDVKVETHGFFATFLNFGNLQVQTAGPEAGFYFITGIPKPSRVRNTILDRVDMTTEHKSSFEYNKEQRPEESV